MSTTWSVYCVDCDKSHEIGTRALERTRATIRHAKALADVADLFAEPSCEALAINHGFQSGETVEPAWFKLHAGHKLVPRDEYGRIDGECGEPFRCACCSSRLVCRLAPGHEDEHAPAPRSTP